MHFPTLTDAGKFGTDFCRCGFTGWCLECFWTGLGSFKTRGEDKRLLCHTSVWMFPIYGLAAFIPSIYKKIKTKPICYRGGVYAFSIFFFEYVTGSLLKKHNACPWDYSSAKFNIKGLIRLDYGPCWAAAGLLFEKLLCKEQ